MPVAFLNSPNLADSKVDREKGVVRACQMAKGGKLATFKNLKGEKTEILMTPRVISGLLALFAAADTATAHWTHAWLENGDDGLSSKVASFRDFRIEDGDLIADAHLWPTDKKDAILHAAENDPTGMMISTVFDYEGGTNDAVPTRVHAADFVEVGASTTALCAKLSKTQNTAKMAITIDDIKEVLSTPEGEAYLNGILKAHGKMKSDAGEDAEAAVMEKDAGVTDADKKPEDDQKPALMRSMLRVSRANARLTAALKSDRDAIMADVDLRVKASETALLGKNGGFKPSGGDGGEVDFESKVTAALAAMPDGKKDRSIALLTARRAHPDLFNAAKAAGKI